MRDRVRSWIAGGSIGCTATGYSSLSSFRPLATVGTRRRVRGRGRTCCAARRRERSICGDLSAARRRAAKYYRNITALIICGAPQRCLASAWRRRYAIEVADSTRWLRPLGLVVPLALAVVLPIGGCGTSGADDPMGNGGTAGTSA